MQFEGFYSFVYRGHQDWGCGMLVLQSGIVIGADAGGVQYDGRYSPTSTGMIELDLTLHVPPGVALVQGIPAKAAAYDFPIRAVVPAQLGSEHMITIPTAAGNVNVAFRKVR
jgi:hypothetical protein